MIFTLLGSEHVMKKSRFTEAQITFAAEQFETCVPVEELFKKMEP
jgi:hypothetical protein